MQLYHILLTTFDGGRKNVLKSKKAHILKKTNNEKSSLFALHSSVSLCIKLYWFRHRGVY